MLKHLYINNFTLIDQLDISFYPGFSVITGETGAGKSIIIGAVGLLLGNRADAKMIKSGKNKCVVEAVFSTEDNDKVNRFFETNDLDYDHTECILRREINASGKSRAFINDTPVVISLLKELGGLLLDIHSQHQNMLLSNDDFQLNVVDSFANNKDILDNYLKSFQEYKCLETKLEELTANIERNRQNEDFLRFQQKELTEATFEQTDEQEELERISEVMTHAEEIKESLYSAHEYLNNEDTGIITQLRNTLGLLDNVSKVYPKASELRERVDNCFIELKDIGRECSICIDDIDYDPAQLSKINERLDLIYTLEKKYHVETIAELIDKLSEINTQLSQIDNFDDEKSQLETMLSEKKSECEKKARHLSSLRKKAALTIEKELALRLVPLGIPNVRFKIDITPTDTLGRKGCDKVIFLFSSNTSSPLMPVSQVASGGEISRVMLSIKALMSHITGSPTIIFDEIDTGVSGRISEKMAHIMKEMSGNNHQVICITHLPQIAAVGDTHYKVVKTETENGTSSVISQLSAEDRVTEIAQMLSGSDISQAAIDNAKSLLNNKNI